MTKKKNIIPEVNTKTNNHPDKKNKHPGQYKQYKKWLQSNPKCQCGCNQPITSSYKSFLYCMKTYGRPPIFKFRHNNLSTKTQKYYKEYKEWFKTERICECGCNSKIELSYNDFAAYYRKFNKFPKFRKHHAHSTNNNQDNIYQLNGCTIKITDKASRCSNYQKCYHYLKCLEFVTIEKRGLGWTIQIYQ